MWTAEQFDDAALRTCAKALIDRTERNGKCNFVEVE